ncbi:MAG: cobalamin B12-binding domain-containing protein [Rhodothermales bacterium]|nr:cobalamin B12-binding domain-containing protein [Rhodothermales bacterium]
MNNSVTTRQASELLDVHESSIKRWCNSDELPYWSTPGGHRRIQIGDLVTFARQRGISSSLAAFDSHAEAVWSGVDAAQNDDYGPIVSLMYTWIDEGWSKLPAQLLEYLELVGFDRPQIFDNVVGPSMSMVGENYGSAEISVGDEHRMTQAMRSALLMMSTATEGVGDNGVDRPIAIVGCGPNEMHELGALMSRLVLESEGWKVVYVGADMPTEDFAAQQSRYSAELVCISLMNPIAQPAAASIYRTLDLLASRSGAYRLAIGGRSLMDRHDLAESGNAITDAFTFSSMNSFVAWVRDDVSSVSD